MRALVVEDKAERVRRVQHETVASANHLIAAMGLDGADQLHPAHYGAHRRPHRSIVQPAASLTSARSAALRSAEEWAAAWTAASPSTFQ